MRLEVEVQVDALLVAAGHSRETAAEAAAAEAATAAKTAAAAKAAHAAETGANVHQLAETAHNLLERTSAEAVAAAVHALVADGSTLMALATRIAETALLGLLALSTAAANALGHRVIEIGLGLEQLLLLSIHTGSASTTATEESTNYLSAAN